MSLNNRGWSSRDQNKALSDLNELLNLVVGMYDDVKDAICRNRYGPGLKKTPVPGELREMEGIPGPTLRWPKGRGGSYPMDDPIGEDATWPDEIDDLVDRKVRAMVRTIGHVRNSARWMKEQSARRTVEVEREEYLRMMCQACRTGGHPRLIRKYCRPCYDRWVYLGRRTESALKLSVGPSWAFPRFQQPIQRPRQHDLDFQVRFRHPR